jgi:NADH-quinone oxidoreductase subunit I
MPITVSGPRRQGFLDKMKAIAKGMVTVATEATSGARVTTEYPEEHYVPYPRWRGRHVLHRHENGLEKCIGCSLCAAACPARCIQVVAAENTADNRVSEGERYAAVYEINMLRCIFCGFCVEACPTEALDMTGEYELATYSRDEQIYTKERLLEPMPVRGGAHVH